MKNIIEITELSDPRLDVYARLRENQLVNRAAPEEGIFIGESPLVIGRALDAGCEPLSFLMERRHVEHQGKALLERCPDTVPVFTAEEPVLAGLTGFHLTRGMLCAMRRPETLSEEAVCQGARRLVVLEDVMNPTNMGAIFRSAAALGIDGVLLTPACTDPLYRRAIRVSMGNVFNIPWAWMQDENWLARLHDRGFRTAALALREDSYSIADPKLLGIDRLALVMGTEGDGLAPATIAACDYTVKIPMTNGVDSLNVAAASAVAFYQLGLLSRGE